MNNTPQSPIVVERLMTASPAAIWRALTDKNEMKQWYFDLPDFRPEAGFRFSFTGGPSPDRQYVHLCEIIEAIPGTKLSYTWCYEGYEGESIVSFELIPQGAKTLVRLTHAGLHTFPRENPDLARHNFEAGWDDIVNRSLEGYVGKIGL